MDSRVSFLRLSGCVGLLLLAAVEARAAAGITSPFLSASGASAAATSTAPIELHGYMVTPDGERFSIYDPAKKTAAWVKLNETGYPFVVRSYKQENSVDQVTVDYQGTHLTLALKQAKIASAAPAGTQAFAGRAGGAPGNFGPRGNGGPGVAAAQAPMTAAASAQEAARLQAAAMDFQQRQLQRQQAAAALQAQQGQQVVQPAGQRQGRINGGGQQGAGRRGARGQQ